MTRKRNLYALIGDDDNMEEEQEKEQGRVSKQVLVSCSTPVSEAIIRGVRSLKLMSSGEFQIDTRTIRPLLEGKDVVTIGSPSQHRLKPLMILIPAVELLHHHRDENPCILILAPSRALCFLLKIQAAHFSWSMKMVHLMARHSEQTVKRSRVVGDQEEPGFHPTWSPRNIRGVNLIISTPSDLEYFQKIEGFGISNLTYLMIADADRILEDEGNKDQLTRIIKHLPKPRGSAVFCNALSLEVKDFASSMFPNFISLKMYDASTKKVHCNAYILIRSSQRLWSLCCFLKRHLAEKLIVFFSSDESAIFHSQLLRSILKTDCFVIHGKQDEAERDTLVSDYSSAESGILLCTNGIAINKESLVAGWYVQYETPDEEYMSRVRRRTRGELAEGVEVLFLIPYEIRFLGRLRAENLCFKKFLLPRKDLYKEGALLEETADDGDLWKSGFEAFRSYLSVYRSHSMTDVFRFNQLNQDAVAASFCLSSKGESAYREKQKLWVQDEICVKMEEFNIDPRKSTAVSSIVDRICDLSMDRSA